MPAVCHWDKGLVVKNAFNITYTMDSVFWAEGGSGDWDLSAVPKVGQSYVVTSGHRLPVTTTLTLDLGMDYVLRVLGNDGRWASGADCSTFVPTSIQLVSLRATREGSNVNILWQVASENNTLGYRIYRSLTGTRASATQVTAGMIAASGSGTGASYVWTDTLPPLGQAYYWIEEVERDGTTVIEYGPATVGPPVYQTFIPMVRR